MLTQNQVRPAEAQQLAVAGLTEDQARHEIAALDLRTITKNRGGMLYKACRAALEGQAWNAPTPDKPRRKLSVKPPSVEQSLPLPPDAVPPPMEALRAARQGKNNTKTNERKET